MLSYRGKTATKFWKLKFARTEQTKLTTIQKREILVKRKYIVEFWQTPSLDLFTLLFLKQACLALGRQSSMVRYPQAPESLLGSQRKDYMVLYGIVWLCMVLHGIVWHCMVLYGVTLTGQPLPRLREPTTFKVMEMGEEQVRGESEGSLDMDKDKDKEMGEEQVSGEILDMDKVSASGVRTLFGPWEIAATS